MARWQWLQPESKVYLLGVASVSPPGPAPASLCAAWPRPEVPAFPAAAALWLETPRGRPGRCCSRLCVGSPGRLPHLPLTSGPRVHHASCFPPSDPRPLFLWPNSPLGFGNLNLNVVFPGVPRSLRAQNPQVPSGCVASLVSGKDETSGLRGQSSNPLALQQCLEGLAPVPPTYLQPLSWPFPFRRSRREIRAWPGKR